MPTRKSRLLIVDDEPEARLLLTEIFTDMGHDVVSAGDGLAALQQMRLRVPDILVSDLNMPRMSGFELLSVVRRRFPEMYVIVTSGAYLGSAVPEGIAADAFYEKGTGLATLFQIIKTAEESYPVKSRNEVLPVPGTKFCRCRYGSLWIRSIAPASRTWRSPARSVSESPPRLAQTAPAWSTKRIVCTAAVRFTMRSSRG
jgi:CheY-like chemotaxis protein